MKNLKLKLLLTIVFMMAVFIIFRPSVFATNEETIVLKKSDKEYLLYFENNLDKEFEFALTNKKDADKNSLTYKICAKDTSKDDKNSVAYIDEELFNKYLSNTIYVWVRDLDGNYLVNGVELNLQDCVEDADVDLANSITKLIAVNTQNTITTQEVVDEVTLTKTVGKVDVTEDGDNYYCLVKLPNTDDYNLFMDIAEQIANKKVDNNMYAKLEVASQFAELYEKLVPAENSKEWIKVENREILQPEESKNGDQYILWIKNVNSKGGVKIDAQFLTCFEDYKNEVISEKITSVLPVTYDNPVLLIIFGGLVVAFVVVLVIRAKTKTEIQHKGKQ